MALIYHSNFRKLLAEKTRLGFSSPSVTLYSGAQPTAANYQTNWTSYRSNNSSFLWHSVSGLEMTLMANQLTVYGSSFPALTNPSNNGTASWCVIWGSSISLASMANATIPSTQFMIGNVTTITGDGLVKLQSTSLTTSTSVTIMNFGFTISM